ncbi:uncharacterized protein [Asterias amurensis]|uniref:uncharacterized protein isoform X2 n=1 Tax=Asterias amurensis TaxID=7602 RepID=UPI003AB8FAC4
MTDSPFTKKRSVFVKTYSKVRPLQTFRPHFPPSKNTGNSLPASPFRCVLPPSIAPTVAPANSPSSDSSCSDHLDIEIIPSSEADKCATEEEDEKSFVTLTPGAKKSKKIDTKKKSSTPLQNISNFINERHSNKVVPKRTGAPFMWLNTKSKQRAQLDSIQESDLESSSGDDSECVTDTRGKQKAADSKRKTAAQDPKDVEMEDCQERRGGVKKNRQHNQFLQPRGGKMHVPFFVRGRGVFSSPHCRGGKEQSSSQLSGSTAYYTDSCSTAAYTGENEVTSDDSTLMMSDDTGSRYSTTEDTLMEEDYSDIEILRDVPDPAVRVMKSLTPKVAQLFLPNASMATQRKNAVNTTKAMPRKVSSAWLNKKPVTGRKNSTLAEDVSALNIQEYDPIQEISAIKDNSRAKFVTSKITSTPTSKGRNTVIHNRFMLDASSIEGDACALPTIEAMPTLSSSLFSESHMASSSNQRPGTKKSLGPAEQSAQKLASAPRSVKLSSTFRSMSTPLGIQGKKAQTLERSSPKMSPRISFRQYPKSASSSLRNNTAMVSTESVSRNSSSSKQVKFLLSSKARENFSEPASIVPCAVIHIPELCPSPSILKKTHSFETSKHHDTIRSSISRESRGGTRLTSTPQRPSRKTKGAHMLALSFDVSAVDLPSCSDDDLVINAPKQLQVKATSSVTHQKEAPSTLAVGHSTQATLAVGHNTPATPAVGHNTPAVGHNTQATPAVGQNTLAVGHSTLAVRHSTQATPTVGHSTQATPAMGHSTQELMDFDPEPIQVSTSSSNETLKPTTSTPEEVQQGTQQPVTQHLVTQHPVHATPRGQLKRSSPSSGYPGKPNKKRILDKWKLEVANQLTPMVSPPVTCNRATQKNLPIQKKKLEFADKAVGLPECIISRLGPSPLKPAKFWQYVSNDVEDYEKIKHMPQDIMETIPDVVFS